MTCHVTIQLPTASDLFKKHFNSYGQVGLQHPNMEAFFEDLNNICKIEDSLRYIKEQITSNENA